MVLVGSIDDGLLCPARAFWGLGSGFIFPNRIAGGRRRHMTCSLRKTSYKVSDGRKGSVNESQKNTLCQINAKSWVSLRKERDCSVPGAGLLTWGPCALDNIFRRFVHTLNFFFFIVVGFVLHWNESAMGLHVFPIPIPPPTSLSTRSL